MLLEINLAKRLPTACHTKYCFILLLEALDHKLCFKRGEAGSFATWDDVLVLVEKIKMRDFHPCHYRMAEGNAYDDLATELIYRCQKAKMYGQEDQTQKEKDLKQSLKYFRKVASCIRS